MYGSPVWPIMLSFSDEATSTTKVPDPVVADGSARDTDSETEVISSKKAVYRIGDIPRSWLSGRGCRKGDGTRFKGSRLSFSILWRSDWILVLLLLFLIMAPRLYCIDRSVAPGNWEIGGRGEGRSWLLMDTVQLWIGLEQEITWQKKSRLLRTNWKTGSSVFFLFFHEKLD